MRQKIIFIIVLLLVMATLPLAISKNFTKNISKQTFSEKDKQSETFNENSQDFTKETLASLVAAQYRDEYNEETLKAIAVIIHTNYKTKPDSFNFDDNGQFIGWSDLFDYSSNEALESSCSLPVPRNSKWIKTNNGINIERYAEEA